MKTTVNIPDWLVAAVRERNEGRELGELVREALIETLPAWGKRAGDTRESKIMRATYRALRAEAIHAGAAAPATKRRKGAPRRPSAPPAAASGGPPAGRRPAARRLKTRGKAG